ncbi:MAG: hypothetical protein ACO3LZ_01685, partial [Candidatus Nanopelagicales bacterium]
STADLEVEAADLEVEAADLEVGSWLSESSSTSALERPVRRICNTGYGLAEGNWGVPGLGIRPRSGCSDFLKITSGPC